VDGQEYEEWKWNDMCQRQVEEDLAFVNKEYVNNLQHGTEATIPNN